MILFYATSLRFRLMMLVILAVLPIVGFTVYRNTEDQERHLRKVEDEAQRLTEMAAGSIGGVIEGSRQMLFSLAYSQQARTLNAPAASALFNELLAQSNAYITLGLTRPDGLVIASGLPPKFGVNANDKPWYGRVQINPGLSIGEYQVGKINGNPSLHLAFPLPQQKKGEPMATVFASLSLSKLQECISRPNLPPSAAILVTDRRGIYLARNPNPEKWLGTKSNSWIALQARGGKTAGFFETTGVDGIRRLYHYVPIPGTHNSLWVAVGISKAVIQQESRAEFQSNMLWLGLFTAITLLCAGLFANRSVLRHVRSLTEASAQLAKGDWQVNPNFEGSAIEFQQLGHTFREMAASLKENQEQLENTVKERTAELTCINAELSGQIAERKQSEEANQRLMVAIDQAAESIVFTDCNGSILYVNQGFEKISGYTRQEALGQNPRLLKSGNHPHFFYQEMWATLSRGEVWHGRFCNRRKDGTTYEEEATISPVHNSQGQIVSYVGVKRDITREVQLERQVLEAQKMETVGLLAGGLAHDYNNILAANMLQLGMLMERPDLDPTLREALRALQEGEERGANLTRQLLMFSRRQVIQMHPIELNALVERELKMLQRLLGEQTTLVMNPESETLWVNADEGMLEQVIMNLCINARDAMPKGGQLTVGTKSVEIGSGELLSSIEARPGKFFCLSVADSGCGMSEETQQRIFEPFFTTKKVGHGTGLGLSTVYGIIKQHNGWIEVTSTVGKGSEFRVFLPATSAAASRPTPITPPSTMGGKETILVVEDDASVKTAMVMCLRSRGYRVIEVNNALEALEEWRKADQIDLLITDIIMPGETTGLELAQTLRKSNPSLPVILMSGYSNEILDLGIPSDPQITYLAKPCTANDLIAAVRNSLDHAST